ncbi:MAG: ankyrin repeat domain-containing protein [Planctomycetota bacterium]
MGFAPRHHGRCTALLQAVLLGMAVSLLAGPNRRLGAADDVFALIGADKTKEVEALLKANPNLINATNDKQESLILCASRRSNQTLIEFLIAQGADPNRPDPNGRTPVMLCAEGGRLGCVQALVNHGANLNLLDNNHHGVLIYASSHPWGSIIDYIRQVEAVDIPPGSAPAMDSNPAGAAALASGKAADFAGLLKADPLYVYARDTQHRTALMLMADQRNSEATGELLQNKSFVDAVDADGRTALMHAAIIGAPDVINLLLPAGADPLLTDKDGQNALALARANNRANAAALLEAAMKTASQPHPIADAALLTDFSANRPGAVRGYLARHPERANATDAKGQFPLLILAASSDEVQMEQVLIAAHANLNAPDFEGLTALMRAAKNGAEDSVKLLMYQGADPYLKSPTGETAEAYARERGHTVVADYLHTILLAQPLAPGGVAAPPAPPVPPTVMGDFEDAAPTAIWEVKGGQASVVADHASHGQMAIKMASGSLISAWNLPVKDWSTYDSFQFDVYLDGTAPGKSSVTVCDQPWVDSGNGYYERYNANFTLHPGANTITIPVHGMYRGEADHHSSKLLTNIDPAKITRVDISFDATTPPQTAYLDYIRLVKTGVGASNTDRGAPSPIQPGLIARFFKGKDFSPDDFLVERIDSTVDFDWNGAAPTAGVPSTYFCIRWTGILRVTTAGHYTLATVSDDGSRLTLDGNVIVSQWLDQPAKRVAGLVDLTAGDHELQLDYFQGSAESACKLLWSLQDGFGEQVIPAQALWHGPSNLSNLFRAIDRDDLPTVKAALASLPALATQADASGRTALHAAAASDPDIVSLLLADKVDPNKADAQNWRPIHIAAEAGRADIVKLLLENRADPNPAAAPGSQTPLYIAAIYGFTDVAKYLLAGHADPNIAAQDGETPLQCAAKNGYTDIVSLLILAKADLNAKDAAGHTALDDAVAAGHTGVASLLKKYGAAGTLAVPPDAGIHADPKASLDPVQEKAFLDACYACDTAKMDALLKLNPNLAFSRDPSDYTGLHALACASRASPEMAEKLLDLGVPVDIRHKWGRTPLHRACEFGNLALIKFFLQKGADINALDDNHWSPLYFAAQSENDADHVAAIQYLLDHKADPTLKSKDGLTPYGVAKQKGNTLLVKVFEEHGITQ